MPCRRSRAGRAGAAGHAVINHAMPQIDAYIGLGSNLDDPEKQLRRAARSLGQLPQTRLCRMSSFYQSRAVGPPQPDFINAVALVTTGLSAPDLLRELQLIEDRQGRIRNMHWGPRTLDLDVLLYGETVIHEDHLVIPHPEMHRRGFVLYPLYEISPDVVIPGQPPLRELLEMMNPGDVQKLD